MSEIDKALRIGCRVVVTGMAGAGKSTFARQLAAKTGLPAIHLDVHFWKPGWVEPSEEEWRDVQTALLAGEAWIADGNYHETLDLRLARVDTVVYLDTPWWVCAARVRAWVAPSRGSVARRLRHDGVATIAGRMVVGLARLAGAAPRARARAGDCGAAWGPCGVARVAFGAYNPCVS